MPFVKSESVEKLLSDKGVAWELHDVPIADFDEERSKNNQARISSPLIPSVVETYVAAMKREDEFPALVAYRAKNGKYVVIDGNHRFSAAKAANVESALTYVVAPDTGSELITMLTYEANSKHGLPTSEAERARHAVHLIENAGESIKHAAARMNLSEAFLQRHYAKIRANTRAAQNGIPESRWHELKPTSQQRLNALTADESFKAATEYVIKARLDTVETEKFVTRLNKETSVTEQLRMINEEEQDNRARIQDVATGKVRPRQQTLSGPRRTFYNGYTQIAAVSGTAEAIDRLAASFAPIEAEEWAGRCRQMQDALTSIQEALEKRAQE